MNTEKQIGSRLELLAVPNVDSNSWCMSADVIMTHDIGHQQVVKLTVNAQMIADLLRARPQTLFKTHCSSARSQRNSLLVTIRLVVTRCRWRAEVQ